MNDVEREVGVSSVTDAVHGHASRLSIVCCCGAMVVEDTGAGRCLKGRDPESSSPALRFLSLIAMEGSGMGRAS